MSLATHVLQLGDQLVDHLEDALVNVLGGENDAELANASVRGSKPPVPGAAWSDQRRVEPRSPGFETARRRNYEAQKGGVRPSYELPEGLPEAGRAHERYPHVSCMSQTDCVHFDWTNATHRSRYTV